jgi:glycosyltransferase involved in cell wall biosynthesis
LEIRLKQSPMFDLLAAFKNIVRTYLVFHIFQNKLFRNQIFLKTIALFYGLFHASQVITMARYLFMMESMGNKKIVIGNSGGSGGTSHAAKNFTHWLGKHSDSYEIELYSGPQSKGKAPSKIESSSKCSECFVIDSKIALICVFLFQYREMKVNLFTWNHFDFTFHFSNLLRDRKNVNLVDYVARKNRSYFGWNEEIMFKTLENFESTSILARGAPEVHFIGRLTFQKGIDRFLRLAKANTTTRFNVYGDGPLLGYVRHKKPANIYIHGFQNQPFRSISTDDLVIVPSRYFEGVPLVLLEAIYRNIKVISSGTGDLSMVTSELHFVPGEEENFFDFSDSLIKKNVSSDN